MQLGRLYLLETDPATQFTAAISADAQEILDWVPDPSISADPTCRFRVVGVILVSDQNLGWDLFFWRTAAGPGASIADNSFIGFLSIAAAAGKQVGGAGAWYYAVYADVDLAYFDEDDPSGPGTIHLGLVPRGGGKNAGATGEIKIGLLVDPTLGGQ